MILGIGIDIIDIERFTDWHTKSEKQLSRVFSPLEINYCMRANKQQAAEGFAVRFAAREAFFKAYHAMLYSIGKSNELSLLAVQKEIFVTHLAFGVPTLNINWENLLPEDINPPRVHLSLSHANTNAVAMVVLER